MARVRDYTPFPVHEDLDKLLREEFEHAQKANPEWKGGIRDYMHILLGFAVERERKARLAHEQEGRLIQPATTVNKKQADEWSARLQALKGVGA